MNLHQDTGHEHKAMEHDLITLGIATPLVRPAIGMSFLTRLPSLGLGLVSLLPQWMAHKPHPSQTRAPPARPAAPDGFSRAIECLHRGEWQEAFDAMARAADGGDPRAARIALLMLDRGPRLFSQRFCASPTQRTRWAEDPARAPR